MVNPAARQASDHQPGEPTTAGPRTMSARSSVVNPQLGIDRLVLPISAGERGDKETVEQPAKVIRIGSMTKQLLDEVHQAPLDEASRRRMRGMYAQSITELSQGLSDDLRRELTRVTSPFQPDEVPSEAELRLAQAQLVGWLDGLFLGIHSTLLAEQAAAQDELDRIRAHHSRSPDTEDPLAPHAYL